MPRQQVVPTHLPDIPDYMQTNDCSGTYFNGSYLEFTDSKGRLRLAKIASCDRDEQMFHYWVVTIDGLRLSQNTFRKPFSEFRVLHNLPPIVFMCDGIAHWGGGTGVHTNSKSSSEAQMYSTTNGRTQSPMEVRQLVSYLSTIKAGTPEVSSLGVGEALDAVNNGDVGSVILSKDLFVTGSSRRGAVPVFQGISIGNRMGSRGALIEKLEGLI